MNRLMYLKEGKYNYVIYAFLVIIAWGAVPSFAKLGNLPGGVTTVYVNWFAVIGLLPIMLLNGSIKEFKKPQPYKKIVLWGTIWPLAYSICYFTSVDKLGGSITTILNYVWPFFFLVLATLLKGKRYSVKSWAFVSLSIVGVLIAKVAAVDTKVGLSLSIFWFVGLGAALAQALYSVLTDGSADIDAWLITMVVEIVTAVGATIYSVSVIKDWVWVWDPTKLFYLSFLGVISNGLGFWAFLRGNQVTSKNDNSKTIWLVLMCMVPFVQVLLLPVLRVESVPLSRWVAVGIVTLALIGYRVTKNKGG